MRLYAGSTGGTRATLYFTPKYTFPGNYRYLCCEHQVRGYAGGNMGSYGAISALPASGGSASPTFVSGAYKRVITSATNTLTAKAATCIDISGISGEYWICLTAAGSSNGYTGEFWCYNLWLSNEVPT